jgi:hypothetical protein
MTGKIFALLFGCLLVGWADIRLVLPGTDDGPGVLFSANAMIMREAFLITAIALAGLGVIYASLRANSRYGSVAMWISWLVAVMGAVPVPLLYADLEYEKVWFGSLLLTAIGWALININLFLAARGAAWDYKGPFFAPDRPDPEKNV